MNDLFFNNYEKLIQEDLNSLTRRTDAKTIDSVIQKHATILLINFRDLIIANKMEWKHPNISTEGNGDIVIEWIGHQSGFSIYISANEKLEYLCAPGISVDDMTDGDFDINDFVSMWTKFVM